MWRGGRAEVRVVVAAALAASGCAQLLGVEDWNGASAGPGGGAVGSGGGADGASGTATGAASGGAAGGAAGAGGGCAMCGGRCCGPGTTCSQGACTCLAGIRARANTSCALTSVGSASCWGNNLMGQLGVGSHGTNLPSPMPVVLNGISALALGELHACAIRAGEVWCWGDHSSSELGYAPKNDDEASQKTSPVPSLAAPAALALGYLSGCALGAGGTVACWGANTYGQLGVSPGMTKESLEPQIVAGITGAVQVAFGYTHACALRSDHTLACWGANEHGQLGSTLSSDCGGAMVPCSSVPIDVPVADVAEVAVGSDHTCVRNLTNEVLCWGSNTYGESGDVANTNPCPDTSASGTCRSLGKVYVGAPAVALALGSDHSCALMEDGSSVCWGNNASNTFGTLGTFGTPTKTLFPPAVELALGVEHMCVRTATDEVWCAGANGSGQIGNGGFDPTMSPTQISVSCP